MKAKPILLLILVAALAAGGGWLFGRRSHAPPSPVPANGARKILFYQSAMHPWIKSDKPGKCTICGMDLVPVYEGDKGFDATPGLVALNSNSITVIGVQTAEVKRQPLVRSLRVAGTIDDDDTRHRILSAYVDGRIEKLFVNYTGAEVVAGQPLAVLYSPTLFAAEREYLSLLKQAGSAGGSAIDLTRLIEFAAFKLKRLGLTDAQITALPTKGDADYRTEILAPMTGTVVAREAYEGKYVKEGDKLFEIGDFATMWFKFDLYERDFGWVKPGQRVEITTPALAGQVLTGAVTFVDPNLSEMTRSAKVRVEIPNPLVDDGGAKRRLLRHRLYAEAKVNVEMPESLVTPREAVLSPGGDPIVYVDKGGGAYEQRRVKLGRAGDSHWEILDGLAAGERVVLNGNLLIDAQAQLNTSVSGAARDHGTTATNPPGAASAVALAEPEHAAALEFLKFVATISDALAADEVAKFNELAAASHTAMEKLTKTAGAGESFKLSVGRIQATGHLAKADDLAAARKEFYPLSMAAVELARLARGPAAALKIFECPMTKDIFPGAPAKAQWLQFDATKRNPYMGKRMLDCGTEVK
ncbi:MAG: efflux RND transporter periplasmic adaptor subunit [Verrucomicrobia bacterium]|nr:efflux RND transporter periplasmic adaptor subunit [Verrucomicrobiota bacterium]